MVNLPSLRKVALLLPYFPFVTTAFRTPEELLITAPPIPQATPLYNFDLFRRQQSCQYGQCGATCLAQGAFCCGPAGTVATSPFWVCDNGACITSVRGTTGIVDCYDPDNPAGTTQSCLDETRTSTCNPTDRCFTCSADQPFCQWETYIASNSPTLRWFSCVETKNQGLTFYANTITSRLPSSTSAATSSTSPSASSSPPAATKGTSLSTGAIIGIAVGGGIAVVGGLAILAYCCLRKRKPPTPPPQELSSDAAKHQMAQTDPAELDSAAAYNFNRSELNSDTAYTPRSQPSTPFSPPERYGHSADNIDIWRHEASMTPAEQQTKELYFGHPPQSPRELHEGQRQL